MVTDRIDTFQMRAFEIGGFCVSTVANYRYEKDKQ